MKTTRAKRLFFSVLFSTVISSLIFSLEQQPLQTSYLEESLRKAIKYNDLPNAKRAIESRANINTIDSNNGCTPLELAMNSEFAVEHNNAAVVKLLIANGACVHKKKTSEPTSHSALYSQSRPYSYTRNLTLTEPSHEIKLYTQKEKNLRDLIYYAYQGNLKQLTSLLSKKEVEIDQPNNDGLTALLCATKEGYTNTVTLLLKHKADVNQQIDERGPTPLAVAATHGHLKTTKLLLKYKADIDRKINNKHTSLMFAEIQGHTTIVTLLLQHNANPAIEGSKNGCTPSEFATNNNNSEVVTLSISNEARVHEQKTSEFTNELQHDLKLYDCRLSEANELVCLAWNGEQEKLNLLLSRKEIDINQEDSHKRSALISATNKGHVEIVKLLLDYKANVDQRDNHKRIALTCAVRENYTKIVKLLLAYQAYVDQQASKGGPTPLTIASTGGRSTIVKLLLASEASVDKQIKNENTALMLAARNGHPTTAVSLLANEADVNKKNKDGCTALMLAARNGHSITVTLLLAHVVDLTIRNKDGHTALALAQKNDHTTIVELLTDEKNSY